MGRVVYIIIPYMPVWKGRGRLGLYSVLLYIPCMKRVYSVIPYLAFIEGSIL